MSLAGLQVVCAHEGHRALPTRGMEINAETGSIILTHPARKTLDVQTSELSLQPITHSLAAYGSLVAPWNQHALVSAPLAGRIVSLKVVAGEMVRAGQLLAELECPALEQLQLDLRSAKIELELSERLVEAIDAASRSGAIPGMRFIEAESKRQQARAALEIAKAKWQSLRLPQDQLEGILREPRSEHRQRLALRSPIDGVITHTDLSIGKTVVDKEHLLEVLDLTSVWLKISILEKDISEVRVGQRVELRSTSRPEQVVTGVIDVVDRFLDPDTHLATAWATLRRDSNSSLNLMPGMSGSVRIYFHQLDPKLVVPSSAVIRDGAERFVLVEQENTLAQSTYQKQSVFLGRRSGGFIEVRGGKLFPGDRVVTRGSHELGSFFAKGVLQVSAETARDIGLAVQPVTVRDVAKTMAIDGVIDLPPTHRASASSSMPGTIERIAVDRGQEVHRGDVIAEIVSQEFQDLQLNLLRVELDAALQQTVTDNLRLARSGVSERQLLEAESQLSQTRSRRDALLRQLRIAGLNDLQLAELLQSRKLLATLPVIAPIDGVIVGFDKYLGHIVRPDEPLFEIHDLSHAWVQGYISERDLHSLQIGQLVRCRLATSPLEVIPGKVVRSGQQLSATDRTLSIWCELDSMPSFPIQHNMLAKLTIDVGGAFTGLALPRSAVVREGTKNFVFIRKDDKTFERRAVEIGPADDYLVGIQSGLDEGEMVAVQGAMELQSGFAALK